jgi:FkbM family methyltransferase
MIVLDIGANNGNSYYHLTNDKSNVVYAFEPTPYLLEKFLYPKEKDNFIVIPNAVSDIEGEMEFKIAGNLDWGCSSLLDFSDDLNHTWPGRIDFKVTDKIKVNTIRMDSFIKKYNISSIDIMHCDTQGNDIKVLRSFGEYINIIKSGQVEGFAQNPLYKDSENSVDNLIVFLKNHQFNIDKLESNDVYQNEINIHFSKRK